MKSWSQFIAHHRLISIECLALIILIVLHCLQLSWLNVNPEALLISGAIFLVTVLFELTSRVEATLEHAKKIPNVENRVEATLESAKRIEIVDDRLSRVETHNTDTARQLEHISAKVNKTADAFFDRYPKLKPTLKGKLATANKVVFCGAFPFGLLKDHARDFMDILQRQGEITLILPNPKGKAYKMAVQRTTKKEQADRATQLCELRRMINELSDFSKDKGYKLFLFTTDYWPSCIYTLLSEEHDGLELMIVTIDNYSQDDEDRCSFVVEAKEKESFNIFYRDLKNILRDSKSSTVGEILPITEKSD